MCDWVQGVWVGCILCILDKAGAFFVSVNNERVRKCDFRDTDKCLFHFTYEYDQDNNVIIKVQRTKGECPFSDQ